MHSEDYIDRLINDAGRLSLVRVGDDGSPTVHDFRRSFAERWAMRVPPVVLKELMRHRSIKTTERFYVKANAQRTADAVYASVQGQGGGLGGAPSSAETP